MALFAGQHRTTSWWHIVDRCKVVWLAALTFVSFVALSIFVARHGAYPNGAWAPGSSDHYSHWSSAILFWHRRSDIWRRPTFLVCPTVAPTPELAEVAKNDTCNIPERAERRPLVTNWRQFARPYPPLWVLWSSPEAALYEHTNLRFHVINRLSIIKHLLAGHVLVFLLGLALLCRAPPRIPRPYRPSAVALLTWLIAVGEIIRWSMLGYYDAIAVAALVLTSLAIQEDRPFDAWLLSATAVALHFRALWYLPIMGLAGARALWPRQVHMASMWLGTSWPSLPRPRRRPGATAAVKLLLGASIACAALWVLRLIVPGLQAFPHTNPVLANRFDAHNAEHWNLLLAVIVAGSLLLSERAWGVLILLACQLEVITRTPQVMPWHSLFLLPLLVFTRGNTRTEVAGLILYLVESVVVFQNVPLPGVWLAAVASAP